jgi:hypothetical protein
VAAGPDVPPRADVPGGADQPAGADGAAAQGTDVQADAVVHATAADEADGPEAADSAQLADRDAPAVGDPPTSSDAPAAGDNMATPSGRAVDQPSAEHVGVAGDADRRDDDAAPASTHERDGGAPAETGDEPEKPAAISASVDVTVVPGVARYHRSECILIRFLGPDDLDIMTRQVAEADGCVPCRACQPDKLPADA